MIALLAAALVIVSLIVLVPARSTPDASEFYALGADGKAENYPRQVSTSEEVNVTVGIVNGETTAVEYRIEVWVVDTPPTRSRMLVKDIGWMTVPPGERLEQPLSWKMPWAGNDQRIELLLFAGSDEQPHRHLDLWLNVESEAQSR